MTLADPTVRKLLRQDFVCTWGNVDGDPTAGSSYAHQPDDPAGTCIRGNGEHNVQILVLSPDRELIAVTAGYLAADDLVEELGFARDLHAELRRATAAEQLDQDERRTLVADAHERRRDALAQREYAGPLADWARRRALADHAFAARRALMPAEDFRIDDLVGNARTFFGSSNGGDPTGRIGELPAGVDDLLRGKLPATGGGRPTTGKPTTGRPTTGRPTTGRRDDRPERPTAGRRRSRP